MDIFQTIKEELKVEKWQVEAAVKLIDEGCTIPFISRYRKEATGSLNDEQLRDLHERLLYLRNLEEKKEQVLGSIEEQGKLTEELREKILAAQTLVVVEDLYRPYRPKRKTKASVAKAKGLDGLAEYILAQEAAEPVESEAAKYVTGEDIEEERKVKTVQEAIQGAKDIIAEAISDNADYRSYIREATVEEGVIAGGAGQGVLEVLARQGAQVPAHRRLGDIQRARRRRDALQPRHRQKYLNALLCHGFSPLKYNI